MIDQGFILARRAANDLHQIHEYISDDDLTAANAVLDDVRTAIRRLVLHPGLGHLRDDLGDERLRVWTVHSYLVIYRPDTEPLQIVRVISGYRDLAAVFTQS